MSDLDTELEKQAREDYDWWAAEHSRDGAGHGAASDTFMIEDEPPAEAAPASVGFYLENPYHPVIARNIRGALARRLPWVEHDRHLGERCVIVGKGPSLDNPNVIEGLHHEAEHGAVFVGIKEAAEWLIAHELPCHYYLNCDAAPHQVDRTLRRDDIVYLLATCCDPSLFDHLSGYRVQVFHSVTGAPGEREIITENLGYTVSQGVTVACRSVPVALWMGFRAPVLMAGVDCGMPAKQGADGNWYPMSGAYAADMRDGAPQPALKNALLCGSANGTAWLTRLDFFYAAIATAKMIARGWVEVAGDSLALTLLHEPEIAKDHWKSIP